MGGAEAGKKKGANDGSCRRCAVRCKHLSKKAWVTLGRPSIHTFFLWSSMIFLVCGLFTVVSRDGAGKFFCSVRPQREFGGMGCEMTTENKDVLLIGCPKPSCLRNALNITYKVDAMLARGRLYEQFIDASTDINCNTIMSHESVLDPVSAISRIYKKSTDTALAATQSCVDYHCGVLLTALNSTDLMTDSGTCTNTHGSKSKSEASSCICNDMLQSVWFDSGELLTATSTGTSSTMQAIQALCGESYTLRLFGMCATWKQNYPKWCIGTTVTTTATTHTITTTTSATDTSTTTLTSTTSTTLTTTVLRRLADAEVAGSAAPLAEEGDAAASSTVAEPAGPVAEDPAAATGSADAVAAAVAGVLVEDASSAPAPAPAPGAADTQVGRALQSEEAAAPAPAGVANNDLLEYTVRDWSPCTCYQQCSPGLRTRIVECLANTCKAPKPAGRESCICGHVAQCTVDLRLIVLMSVYLVQTAVAFIVFLFYLRTLSHSGEDFIQMGFFKKIGGFFYKQLPPFLRFLVLLQLLQVIWLLLDVWVQTHLDPTGPSSACFESRDLRLVSTITPIFWLVQVLLGRCTKTWARKPDWLYVPERPSRAWPLRQFRTFFRCLGP